MCPNSSLSGAALWLLVLLSPIGAPLVGAVISHCPPDLSLTPGGPFAIEMSYCGVNRPIEHLYQRAIIISMFPMVLTGPFFGGLITATWWLSAAGTAGAFLWSLWRAFKAAIIERL